MGTRGLSETDRGGCGTEPRVEECTRDPCGREATWTGLLVEGGSGSVSDESGVEG